MNMGGMQSLVEEPHFDRAACVCVCISVYLCVTLIYYCSHVTKYQITDLFSGIILFMKYKTTIINGPTSIIRLMIFLEMTYFFLHQTYRQPLS